MMIGRDAGPLIALLNDDDPQVRGRAAYVLATALTAGQDIAGALRERLDVERDPTVQMNLILGLAQHDSERDLATRALDWTRALWSDPASASGVRLGAAIAWLALTPESAPPELRRVLADMPMPATYELAWIWWLDVRPGRLEDWWQDLTR
ncbi:HEAT repeat domain-containing protein [Micromonospora profundi]|uniref:HEAT repeat domain-containing protein n=1 Tax=Micromonospora profundi TaxID=1420889 RepID=A0AAJ6L2E9_9ACTN|nr:HEAT repeat domain-containing protein [Micromonospora profundi]WLS43306.1 HEAT repeat domain-containing protein [Micromonospora profundi]